MVFIFFLIIEENYTLNTSSEAKQVIKETQKKLINIATEKWQKNL